MKLTLFKYKKSKARGGFNLVEATLSLGILSFGFLSLAPMLAVGLGNARIAHTNRNSTQIAATLIEEAKQGTLLAGTTYLDFQGNPVDAAGAAYTAQSTFSPVTDNTTLTRLTLRVTPVGAPDRARTYAVVISAP